VEGEDVDEARLDIEVMPVDLVRRAREQEKQEQRKQEREKLKRRKTRPDSLEPLPPSLARPLSPASP